MILLVDDDLDLVNSMARILTSRGYSVLQAVGLARDHAPQVVVSDIQMPDLNGIETCRQIKQLSPAS